MRAGLFSKGVDMPKTKLNERFAKLLIVLNPLKVDTSKVDVFYTTPPYFNYNWSVHADMPAAQREKITAALLDLNMNNPEGKEILTLNRATKYIPTKPENYKGLESAGRSAGLIR
jgi:phosphonate transport system substrate-binding protein